MSPSLEAYDEVVDHLPVKPIATKINQVSAVSNLQLEDEHKHDLVLRYFRAYIADLCEQFKGGHPGFVTLATKTLESVLTNMLGQQWAWLPSALLCTNMQ